MIYNWKLRDTEPKYWSANTRTWSFINQFGITVVLFEKKILEDFKTDKKDEAGNYIKESKIVHKFSLSEDYNVNDFMELVDTEQEWKFIEKDFSKFQTGYHQGTMVSTNTN